MNPISTRIVTAPEPGGPEKLVVKQVELAPPAADEVLIDVAASGVNRPDVFERMGFYPAPEGAPEGLGLEVSGTVRAIGDDVTAYKPGDRCMPHGSCEGQRRHRGWDPRKGRPIAAPSVA